MFKPNPRYEAIIGYYHEGTLSKQEFLKRSGLPPEEYEDFIAYVAKSSLQKQKVEDQRLRVILNAQRAKMDLSPLPTPVTPTQLFTVEIFKNTYTDSQQLETLERLYYLSRNSSTLHMDYDYTPEKAKLLDHYARFREAEIIDEKLLNEWINELKKREEFKKEYTSSAELIALERLYQLSLSNKAALSSDKAYANYAEHLDAYTQYRNEGISTNLVEEQTEALLTEERVQHSRQKRNKLLGYERNSNFFKENPYYQDDPKVVKKQSKEKPRVEHHISNPSPVGCS